MTSKVILIPLFNFKIVSWYLSTSTKRSTIFSLFIRDNW
jgi:hypothetical protein